MSPRNLTKALLLAVALPFFVPGMVAGAAGPVAVPVPGGTTVVIDNGPDDQTDPEVSGNLVAYTDGSTGSYRIRYRDLATGIGNVVPGADGNDALPAVDGTAIAYIHFTAAGDAAVRVFDTAAGGAPIELDPQPASERFEVAIGGPTVAVTDFAFHDDKNRPEIVVHNRFTGASTRLTDTGHNSSPAVNSAGNVVSWTACNTGGTECRIMVSRLVDGTWTTPLELSTIWPQGTSDTDGSVVVYTELVDSHREIVWQNASGGPEERISLAGTSRAPKISGRLITFQHVADIAGLPQNDLYAYDLVTRVLYRLTDGPGDEVLHDVSVSGAGQVNVAWAVLENSNENVYALSFRLPDIDATAPKIAITAPAAAGIYTLRQPVTAAYACADVGGSGVASCAGPTVSGAALNTGAVGSYPFTVTATDNAGNQATGRVAYQVTYDVCLRYGQSIAQQWILLVRLCDYSGANVSSAATALTPVSLTRKDGSATADPGNRFRYIPILCSYLYYQSAAGLTPGVWVLTYTATSDPIPHTVEFSVT